MVKNNKGITANELVEELHLKPATAQKAIRLAKEQLVKQGFDWYATIRSGTKRRSFQDFKNGVIKNGFNSIQTEKRKKWCFMVL